MSLTQISVWISSHLKSEDATKHVVIMEELNER